MDENILEDESHAMMLELAGDAGDYYGREDVIFDLETPETDDMNPDEEDGFIESQQDYLDYLAERQAEYDDQWGDPIDLHYGY